MIVARYLMIHGRVQGVFYRNWTVETALALGLRGWVRNRRDGGVEAVVEGDADAVASFQVLALEGPTAARVSGIDTQDVAVEGLSGFERRSTV